MASLLFSPRWRLFHLVAAFTFFALFANLSTCRDTNDPPPLSWALPRTSGSPDPARLDHVRFRVQFVDCILHYSGGLGEPLGRVGLSQATPIKTLEFLLTTSI
uniref:(northern house mosquito) hypothetical protein n=1 Tax=Culex pipiens TaxID=7175 RepID=A0A8D8CH26_CULPI